MTIHFHDVPGLGLGRVHYGIGFFNLSFGDEYANTSSPHDTDRLTINGKTYDKVSLDVRFDGDTPEIVWRGYLFDTLTPAAKKKVTDKVLEWLPGFLEKDAVKIEIAAVVAHHNTINAEIVRGKIAEAEDYLAQLKSKQTQLANAGPDEYVSPWTEYQLRKGG